MTWNKTLVIKGQERPKESCPGRSQYLTVPHGWIGLCPLNFRHAPFLCDKITWRRAQLLFLWQSSGPEPVCEPPASHLQMGHHRTKPPLLSYPLYASKLTGTCTMSDRLGLHSSFSCLKAILWMLCFSITAWVKWAGSHQSKEEIPSSLKPHPWTSAVATCPVLPLEFTPWYSRSAFSLYK